MSVKTKAQLTTENTAVIGSQTADNSITPTTDSLFRQDVIDSMVNQSDLDLNGTTLEQYILNIVNPLISTGMASTNPYLFSATKTVTQLPTSSLSANFVLIFEDDFTAPNFDNSNLFYSDLFIAPSSMIRTFVVEQLTVKQTTNGADTYRVRILKNGTEIATSATITANSTIDAYFSRAIDAGGYTFQSAIATGVALVQGDVITAELVFVKVAATLIEITNGKFSNA